MLPSFKESNLPQDYDGLMLNVNTQPADRIEVQLSTNRRHLWVYVNATCVLYLNGDHTSIKLISASKD